MDELELFKKRALEHGLCDELGQRLNECKTRKNYIDLVLGSKGIDYFFDAVNKGWGLPISYIDEVFKPLVNGKYISVQDGYNSMLYCEHNNTFIEAETTIIGLINCKNLGVTVPKNLTVHIYLVGCEDILINGEGSCVVNSYGKNGILKPSVGSIKIKQKYNRDE